MMYNYIQAEGSGAAIVSRPRNFLLKIRLASRRRVPLAPEKGYNSFL